MRFVSLGALLLLLLIPVMPEAQQAGPSARYVSALRTADLFLVAWSNKDEDAGLALVSRHLHSDTKAGLREYLNGRSNPRHWSFEIGAGTEEDSTRFTFPVVLYQYYLGEAGSYRYDTTISVVREQEGYSTSEVVRGQEGWRVDRLPRTGE